MKSLLNCFFFLLQKKLDGKLLKVQNFALARQIKIYKDEVEAQRKKASQVERVHAKRHREIAAVSQVWTQASIFFLFLSFPFRD